MILVIKTYFKLDICDQTLKLLTNIPNYSTNIITRSLEARIEYDNII